MTEQQSEELKTLLKGTDHIVVIAPKDGEKGVCAANCNVVTGAAMLNHMFKNDVALQMALKLWIKAWEKQNGKKFMPDNNSDFVEELMMQGLAEIKQKEPE